MADIAVVMMLGIAYLLVIGLFIRAFKYKVDMAGDKSGKRRKAEHTFDFSRSHHLVMEREKIDDMVNQMYREPMDQFFSLQQWKVRVAEYIADYRNYADGRSKACSKVKNLY